MYVVQSLTKYNPHWVLGDTSDCYLIYCEHCNTIKEGLELFAEKSELTLIIRLVFELSRPTS